MCYNNTNLTRFSLFVKENLSPVMRKGKFYDSLEILKFTRICMENHSHMTSPYKINSSHFGSHYNSYC